MATEIKAIKCPQCGSSQKTEIRPRYYRCTSCQTEYFLDDDRRIVEHEVTYRPPAARPSHSSIGHSVICAVKPMISSNAGSSGEPNVSYSRVIPVSTVAFGIRR